MGLLEDVYIEIRDMAGRWVVEIPFTVQE